jgi:hypothetical protein
LAAERLPEGYPSAYAQFMWISTAAAYMAIASS